jgi:hypothetical protein
MAAGLTTVTPRLKYIAGAALALVIGISLFAYFQAPGTMMGYRLRYAKENWSGAAAYVRQERPDVLIVAPGFLRLPLDRYSLGGVPEVEAAANSAAIPEIRGSRRVGLVLSHTGKNEEALHTAMDRAYQQVGQAIFPQQNLIQVIIYDTSSTTSR